MKVFVVINSSYYGDTEDIEVYASYDLAVNGLLSNGYLKNGDNWVWSGPMTPNGGASGRVAIIEEKEVIVA